MEGTLSERQKQLCLKITQKIIDVPFSTDFLEPVDTTQIKDYLEKIKRPMDLGTIKNALLNNKYHKIEDWKSDIKQVWKNAKEYNPEESFVYQYAEVLGNYAATLLDSVARNESEQWLYSIRYEHKKLMKLLNAPRPKKRPKIVLKPPSSK